MLERVAHFTILEKLGQGGMGIVFKAQDTKLRRLVALKLLPPEHVGDAERRARFMREARSAAAVTHPNIATVYEIGEDEAGRIFIAMELVPGRSLRDELARRAPLGVAETLAIARRSRRGLAKAHDIGLVHRDLKPDNVMLGPEGEVKILDFGLAKARELATPSILAAAVTGEIGAVTDAGVIVGTPGYMSPEQATGGDVDARSDLFSLGIVIFEMLTGKLPFRGTTVGELIAAALRDEPRGLAELAPEAPAPLVALIGRCLADHARRGRRMRVRSLPSSTRSITERRHRLRGDRASRRRDGPRSSGARALQRSRARRVSRGARSGARHRCHVRPGAVRARDQGRPDVRGGLPPRDDRFTRNADGARVLQPCVAAPHAAERARPRARRCLQPVLCPRPAQLRGERNGDARALAEPSA